MNNKTFVFLAAIAFGFLSQSAPADEEVSFRERMESIIQCYQQTLPPTPKRAAYQETFRLGEFEFVPGDESHKNEFRVIRQLPGGLAFFDYYHDGAETYYIVAESVVYPLGKDRKQITGHAKTIHGQTGRFATEAFAKEFETEVGKQLSAEIESIKKQHERFRKEEDMFNSLNEEGKITTYGKPFWEDRSTYDDLGNLRNEEPPLYRNPVAETQAELLRTKERLLSDSRRLFAALNAEKCWNSSNGYIAAISKSSIKDLTTMIQSLVSAGKSKSSIVESKSH